MLALLLLTSVTILSFIALVSGQTRVEMAAMQQQLALTAAESGANETIQYLISQKTIPTIRETAPSSDALKSRWITNDGRYEYWGFPTNSELTILAEPEPLDEGRAFYVTGFHPVSDAEMEIYALGGYYPLNGTNPLIRLLRIKTEYETFAHKGFLQGELIASRQLDFLGNVIVAGTNIAGTDTNANDGVRVISVAYPNIDSFKGSNVIQGTYSLASSYLPQGLQLPLETDTNLIQTNPVQIPADVLKVGSEGFLTNAVWGYETNHLLTRLNWALFPPKSGPAEANCKDAPIVNIGTEEAPQMVYQFDASGDYKITAAELYPIILKTGAVVNLRIPAGYVLAEPPVTMEEKSELTLFPAADMTLGAKSFAAVEKNWKRLTIWGGTNTEQKLIFMGNPDTLLCARIYAPYSEIIFTNALSYSGMLVGGKVTFHPDTRFIGDRLAIQLPLEGSSTNLGTNYHIRVKEWEEIHPWLVSTNQ
ncbi:MAG: hypothetical protein J5773_05215 [Verrucomicrobia bacterium]|nr:hypothetical protein [Verrucomicrobiota bacterium]